MPIFKYKPYYEYSGPTRSDPFRELLSEDQIEKNMCDFYEHLKYVFANTDAAFKNDGAGVVSITTENISEQECDERMKKHLNSLDLFANKIREAKS